MVWLDPSGKQLLQWPIHELETLRGDNVHQSNVKLMKGDIVEIKGITAVQVCYFCIICSTYFDNFWYNKIHLLLLT